MGDHITEELRSQLAEQRESLGPQTTELLREAKQLRKGGEWESEKGWCYKVIETDVPLPASDMPVFRGPFSKIRALNYTRRLKPAIPSYSLVVQRIGRMQFRVRAFQNVLSPDRPTRKEVHGVVRSLMND